MRMAMPIDPPLSPLPSATPLLALNHNSSSLSTSLSIPWGRKPIRAGLSFNSTTQTFTSKTPFPSLPAPSPPITFSGSPSAGQSRYIEPTSNNTAASSDHLRAGFGAIVGWKYLGGSAEGNYTKDLLGNKDACKVSIRCTRRIGSITYTEGPWLADFKARQGRVKQYCRG